MRKKLMVMALIAGLALCSSTAAFAAGSSTNNRGYEDNSSDDDSGNPPASATNTEVITATPFNLSENVTQTKYIENGVEVTVTVVGNDGTTLNQSESIRNGTQHVMLRTTTGGANVGPNGEVICKNSICVITENGVSQGFFVNPETGLPLATGADATYWAYDANGNLVLHYVNAEGYFYTGTHVINGQTVTFNSEGVMLG
ncbi:hypothetical protein [[Clostridium] aminophilum]|uniref:Cell wall binding repeat-containing protein n=1 Tax=[Clostridium] aminophilum TaxID=1526 RepID=A0A1I6JKP6_9FIRM|nr:hypothetical protein [[Clostridium] aminophilum]SFR79477.1 hypothetical protein SAMN02910262_01626 [[Clostridium] aminophilum]